MLAQTLQNQIDGTSRTDERGQCYDNHGRLNGIPPEQIRDTSTGDAQEGTTSEPIEKSRLEEWLDSIPLSLLGL